MSDTRSISQSLVTPLTKRVDQTLSVAKIGILEFIQSYKDYMDEIKNNKLIPESDKINACSAITTLCDITEELIQSCASDDLDKISIQTLVCQKENAKFLLVHDMMKAFHKLYNLDTLTDSALIQFCSDSKTLKEYVSLGSQYKGAINNSIVNKNLNSKSMAELPVKLAKLSEIRIKLNQLIDRTSTLRKSSKTLKASAAYTLVSTESGIMIQRMAEWLNEDNTPSIALKKSCDDAITSINKFAALWNESCILMKRYDYILAVRAKLVEAVLQKQHGQSQKNSSVTTSSTSVTPSTPTMILKQKPTGSQMYSPAGAAGAKAIPVSSTPRLTPQKSH